MRTSHKILLILVILGLLALAGNCIAEYASQRAAHLPLDMSPRQISFYIVALFLLTTCLIVLQAWVRLAKSEEALKKRNQQITFLHQTSREMFRTLDPKQVFRTARELISGIMDCDALCSSSYDPQNKLIRCTYGWVDGHVVKVDQLAPIPLQTEGQGPQSRVIQTEEPLLLCDDQEQPTNSSEQHWLDEARSMGPEGTEAFRSGLIAPLELEGKVVGLIQVLCHRENAYTPEDLDILEGLARQMSVAEANAALYQQAQKELAARRMAEAALQTSQERNTIVLDSMSQPLTYLGMDMRIQWANKAAGRAASLDPKELVGRVCYELWHHRSVPCEDCPALKVKETGRSQQSEISTPDGRLWGVRVEPVLDHHGHVVGMLAAGEDITERKHLEAQLRQAQKMEAIGRLTGGIAHDFNNLLTVINGCSEMLLANTWPGDPVRPDLEQIRDAGLRAAALTQQLLALSRRQELDTRVLNFNDVVRGMADMLHRLIGEDIALHLTLDEHLGNIRGDHGQIEQVVMNLAVNARDAMSEGGDLTLETANVEMDRDYAAQQVGVKPGAYVMLAITDTGCGMSAEVKEHLFEPFFTTKGENEGTGLGLSMVYGIVKQSGGGIQVYSEVGRGTTFKIFLPRVRQQVKETNSRPVPDSVPIGSGTILVVEDEEAVRSLAVRMLQRVGYTALEAPTGSDALALSRQYVEPIHLVLTDVVMPKMSGRDLVRRMRAVRDDFHVLYMSGYTDDTIANHGVLDPTVSFISKPFDMATLASKVHQVLGNDGHSGQGVGVAGGTWASTESA